MRLGLVAFVVGLMLAGGCGRAPVADDNSRGALPVPSVVPSGLPAMSLYHLDATWTDSHGQPVKLRDLSGSVCIVSLFYASCQTACPRLIAEMKQLERDLGPDARQRVRFVLVSIDPEVDTPERLAQLAAEQQLGERWRLLRGSGRDVEALATLLNFKYRKVSAAEYAHSNLLTVLGPQGEVACQQEGLSANRRALLTAIAEQSKRAP